MSYEGGRPLEPQGDGRRISGSVILGLLAVAAIVIFIVQNTNRAEVNFLFFDGDWALWVVIVITIGLTLIAERFIAYAWKRRRNKAA